MKWKPELARKATPKARICKQNSPTGGSLLARDTERFRLACLGFSECLEAAVRLIAIVKRRNPLCRLIVTTSPVPLTQTFLDMDVLCANTVSKSTLRLVCDSLKKQWESAHGRHPRARDRTWSSATTWKAFASAGTVALAEELANRRGARVD